MSVVLGTSASSTARAVTSYRDDTTENKKYIKSVLDLFSIPNFYVRKGRPHGHRYGKTEGDHEYFIANQLKKKCKKREFLSIHDRFIRDTWFRKTMLELSRTEKVISRDGQTGERGPHPHCHRRRTQRVSWQLMDTFEFCGFRHDARKASSWFQRKHCLPCVASRIKEDQAYYPKLVAKLFLVLVELARFLVASFIWDITATMDPALIDRGNLRKQ